MFRSPKKTGLLFASSLSLLGIIPALTSEEKTIPNSKSLHFKIQECNKLIKRYKCEYGIPGIVVAVSQNGLTVYNEGHGYSDVENGVKCHANTLMRIASISKPITCTLAAMLYENGKLDFEKSINTYLDYLPAFKWNDKEVHITCRQLMCHTSGIRHYATQKDSEADKSSKSGDSQFPEFLSNKKFASTKSALDIFITDKLIHEPGTAHLYTTYGFTLLSAVLEKCNAEKSFAKMLQELFRRLDMDETFLDANSPLMASRSKYYERNEKSRLVNVPEVDSSYKYAGGGIVSTTGDLLKFGNHMLRSYESSTDEDGSHILKSSTIKSFLWSPHSEISSSKNNKEELTILKSKSSYGLGWVVSYDKTSQKLRHVYHTGGAVGASSCLFINPKNGPETDGLVVSVLCNSQNAGEIVKFTQRVARIFSKD